MASGSENSGSRSDSFSTGTSASSAGYGGIGQQVNLGALNQASMRGPSSTSSVSAAAPPSPPVGFVPAQSTNPGTVTSVKRA